MLADELTRQKDCYHLNFKKSLLNSIRNKLRQTLFPGPEMKTKQQIPIFPISYVLGNIAITIKICVLAPCFSHRGILADPNAILRFKIGFVSP